MVGKYKVITLCGSTKFKEQYLEAQKRLTLEGNIVISVGLFGHSGDDEVWTEGTKAMLDDMHKRKISIRFFNDCEVRAIWDEANSKLLRHKHSPATFLLPSFNILLLNQLVKKLLDCRDAYAGNFSHIGKC